MNVRNAILLMALVCLCPSCSFLTSKAKPTAPSSRAFFLFNQSSDLTVAESFYAGKTLWVKFDLTAHESDAKQVFYTRAIFDFHHKKENGYIQSFSVPLEFISTRQWNLKNEAKEEVAILESYHWPLIKQELAGKLLPHQRNKGVSLRLNKEEFVLYYDEKEKLNFARQEAKPAEIEILNAVDPESIENLFFASLREILKKDSNTAEKILLALPKEEGESAPFLFVDLPKGVLAILHFPRASKGSSKNSVLGNGIKTADYLILESNVFGLVSRPFSSVLRLFYWSKNTALDMINPQKISLPDLRPIPPLKENRESMDMKAFEEDLDRIVGKNGSSGNIRFLIGGDAFYPRLISALLAAKKSIDFRIFIFDNDDYALKIADILKAKSKEEGVEIHLLLDRMGQIMGEGKMPEDLPAGFTPPSSMVGYLKKDSDIDVRMTPSSLLKADHIKTIIIDKEICFTGGMNIGREYRYDWHDLMMELSGPIVLDTLKDFDLAWANAGPLGDFEYLFKRNFYKPKKMSPEKGFFPIRPLYTRLNQPQIFQAQIHAIKSAKNYIYISNAYFSDDTILHELIKARRRGVDVRVILPLSNNHEIMNANNIVVANSLFRNGIKVFFYPGMSHVKAALYDGWLCLGSANFDHLSFLDNKEFDLATADIPTVEYIKKELFENDMEKSTQMKTFLESGWKDFIAEILAEHL